MSMFLRKKWLLPSIVNKLPPHEPSAQILSFLKLPTEEKTHALIQLSDKFNFITAVLTEESLVEFNKDHPGFTELRNLSGGIIALIHYHIKPNQAWTNYLIEIEKFNYICESEPVGDPEMIKDEDVAQTLKQQRNLDDDIESFSQASQLVQMADLLSQVDDSVNQSIRRAANTNQQEMMELSENDFIIPEDQRKQLDRIPGWVDEELSQVPASQVASVNASILLSVSQSVHKSPAKVPTGFYQGQPALELAMDASFDNSDEENQSKDQDQMNIEKEVLSKALPLKSSSGKLNVDNESTPQKDNEAKVDETFDEETQGPEDQASYNFQTQSLPMTLSTNVLANPAEKPNEDVAPTTNEEPKNSETPVETPQKKTKKKKESKKKAEKPSSDADPTTDASQKETGESSTKSHRSTRSKKKTAKSGSTAEKAEEKTKEKSKSKKKIDKAKDKAKEKTKKKKSATESPRGTSSSSNANQVVSEPTNNEDAPPQAAEQQAAQSPVAQPPAEKPAEVAAPTATINTEVPVQETVVLHDQNAHVGTQANLDPNKVYDEQNRSIPNLNDEDMDSVMMSFHQELESASQLDLNAVPDYIVDVSPDKSLYPIIRDLGSPLITSHTSSQAVQSQLGFHFGHSNQEFSLGMPSDASSQARSVVPSQGSADAVINNNNNNNNLNNASEGSEDNLAGKSSSSISQELISGTMRNLSSPLADKSQQTETPAKEKHSLLEEMLMSDPAEANNITDSQVDNNEEYFTQQPDLLGDSESQWEGARPPATQGVVPVVPQSQGDLHSEFFSSSDDSGKDKQSQNSGQNAKKAEQSKPSNENNTNVTPTTSPTSKRDSISPKARRHLEFEFENDTPSSPTKSPPVLTQKPSSGKFKFSLPKTSSANTQRRINLSTQQAQLPRVISTSPPKFKRPTAKSPAKEHDSVLLSANNTSPAKSKPSSSPEKRPQKEKEIEKEAEREVDVVTEDNTNGHEEDLDLEITSEQMPREDDDVPPLIRVNSTDVREQEQQEPQQRQRSRSKSPPPKESKSRSREEKDDKLKYVIDLEDLSPRFFNKTKKVKHGENNTNKSKSQKGRSAHSSDETTVSPQQKTPIVTAKKTDKKTPSPNSRPGSLGDLIRQSRQQSLASKDPTMEFVIGYFKEVTSEPKPAAVRTPRFASNTNSNTSSSGSSTVGVKRKIDYYGWLDLTSNKKRKVEHSDKKR